MEVKNMCKISEYPALYMKVGESLRSQGLNSKTPGFEISKVAIVFYKIEGESFIAKLEEQKSNITQEEIEMKFFERVKEIMSSPIPSINPVVTNRHPAEQLLLIKDDSISCSGSPLSKGTTIPVPFTAA